MTRLAAVDCGTNSIRLLISDINVVDDALEVTELHRLMEIVRLGEGVDATGRFADDALERVEAALSSYVALMQQEDVVAVRMVATSAARDASNREAFFDMTRRLLAPWGVEAEVISGDEEAALSFRGAVDDLDASLEPFCVIDVGGGSTETIVGTHAGEVKGALSVPMGSVRLTERYLLDSPPSPEQIGRAREYVAEQCRQVSEEVPLQQARTIVGCAGTFTTLSALAQGLETYDPEVIHLSRLRFPALRALTDAVLRSDAAELAANPVIHAGRADVLAGGAVVIDGLMDMFEVSKSSTGGSMLEFYISEKDILDGIVAGLADKHVTH